MTRENLFSAELDALQAIEGFTWRAARIGDRMGGELIGGSVYDLPAGLVSFPYHYHHGVEEWLYVVDGEPRLRTPAGTTTVGPGSLACFPRGPDGAHSVTGPGRVLMLSANHRPSISVYPDSDKLGTRPPTSGDVLNFRREDAVDYWDGEAQTQGRPKPVRAAPAAASPNPPVDVLAMALTAGEPSRVSVGERLGAAMLSATVYELETGQRVQPYRFEYGNEEWALVLSGRPALRDPNSERHELARGDVAVFPDGRAGAHELRNDHPQPARLLILQTTNTPRVTSFPDDGTLYVDPPGRRFTALG